MIDRKRLTAIKELKTLDFDLLNNDIELENYLRKLVEFTDELPAHIKNTKAALEANDRDWILKSLAAICNKLTKIMAIGLTDNCIKLMTDFKNSEDKEKSEAYIEEFLSSVCSLSIDIQMAIYNKETEQPRPVRKNKSASILAVDDHSLFLNTLKSYLKDAPYKLTCVTSGIVALRFLEEHSADLFILDIEMPKMDGYETAQKIRETGANAPIIFLTGNATKEHVKKAIEAGASDFIVKPINKNEVLKKIAQYV